MVSKKIERTSLHHWFPRVLAELMSERKYSSRKLAEHLDKPESLINEVLIGNHAPSVMLAEQLLHGLGYEFEVVARKPK